MSNFLLAGSAGKITGKITDARTKEPLIGANIVIEGTSMGATADVDGIYFILNVPPGVYTLKATFIGYKTFQVNNVRVSVDFTTTVNCALEEGQLETQTVIIEGERTPLIRKDLTNPTASISSESIEALPVTDISKIIGLQAGITVDDDGSIHIRGGYGNEIAYTINGINVNNPYGNTRSVGLATNAVREVSVSGGTFNAEYGRALSGVVNYVTKEGGRTFNGSLRYYTGDHYSNRDELFFNIEDINVTNVWRAEASLGGPILGDDLTFFTSGVYNWYGGSLYAERLYRPEDSYLSREGFPSGDPRRGTASSPYYFGPTVHDTSDLIGKSTGDGKIVPLNWSRSYNIQGNIMWRISSDLKLKFETVIDNTLNPSSSSRIYRYRPDGRAMSNSYSNFYALEITNIIRPEIFFTLKGSYVKDIGKSHTYDDPLDSRYLPSFYSRYIPNTEFLTGVIDFSRFYRESDMYGVKFDMVAQLMKIHEVKFGVELISHVVSVESYTLQFKDPDHPNTEPTFTNMLQYGYTFKPYIPDVASGYVSYKRKPMQGAAYLQDKIELSESIILNVGIRYDYFDPAAQYNPKIGEEYLQPDSILLVKNLTDASKRHMVSPRISVSYPITDRGSIRFSYGHFFQIGSLSSLYSNPYYRAPQGTTPSFGNPDVNPQRGTQYEVGLQQALTENIGLYVDGYYKDVRDYISTQSILTARGDKSYNLLTNLSYANTRGISASLVKRNAPGDPFSATLDYTFQVAEVNRTEPSEEMFFNEQKGRLSETYLIPLGYDRSHTLTTTVTLIEPKDWVISLIGYVRTGTPYTPSFPSSVVAITFVQNSDRQPLQWNVDLKAEKYFTLGGLDFSIFLQVDNLFDTQNELYVYANSGRSLSNIETTTNPTRFNDLKSRINRGDPGLFPLSVLEHYYENPANVSGPRLVRIGASVLF